MFRVIFNANEKQHYALYKEKKRRSNTSLTRSVCQKPCENERQNAFTKITNATIIIPFRKKKKWRRKTTVLLTTSFSVAYYVVCEW